MTNNPLTGFFNVLDSPGNAAGDGKTDDREAIQATITAAVNATREKRNGRKLPRRLL